MNAKGLNRIIPFKWRQQGRPRNGKVALVAYVDAVQVEDLLDETIGKENWETKYYEIKGNLYCTLSIRFTSDTGEYWASKSNCGTESNMEAEKGEASDSFKRAARCWGVGRFLYYMDILNVPVNEKGYPKEQTFGESMTDFVTRVYNPQLPQGYDKHPSYEAFVSSAKIGTKVTGSVNINPAGNTVISLEKKDDPLKDLEDSIDRLSDATDDFKKDIKDVADKNKPKAKKATPSKAKKKVTKAKDPVVSKDEGRAWDPKWIESRCGYFEGILANGSSTPTDTLDQLEEFSGYINNHKSELSDSGFNQISDLIKSVTDKHMVESDMNLSDMMQKVADNHGAVTRAASSK